MQKVVVIVNSGDNVIPRHLLDELAAAAGADTWECIDLPTESRLTQRAPDLPKAGAQDNDDEVFPPWESHEYYR